MRIKDLALGSIVWYKELVLGIKGLTLEEIYGNDILLGEVTKTPGKNPYDYDINIFSVPVMIKNRIEDEYESYMEDESEGI